MPFFSAPAHAVHEECMYKAREELAGRAAQRGSWSRYCRLKRLWTGWLEGAAFVETFALRFTGFLALVVGFGVKPCWAKAGPPSRARAATNTKSRFTAFSQCSGLARLSRLRPQTGA